MPEVVSAIVPEQPAAAPAKAPEVLTNEVVPAVVASETPLSVVPVENAVNTDEKIAEQVVDPEVTANEISPVVPAVAEESLEPAASEIVSSSVPAIAAQTPVTPVTPAVVADAVQQSSEEDDGPEGLIEGLVNTFTLEDGEDGELIQLTKYHKNSFIGIFR